MRSLKSALAVVAVLSYLAPLPVLDLPADARACVVLDMKREDPNAPRSGIDVENVLLVWDEAKHMQHFIREVQFRSKSGGFVFVVPTPSTPEISAVDESIFPILHTMTEPREVHTYSVRPYSILLRSFTLGAPLGDAKGLRAASGVLGEPQVRVLSQQRVAGMDAVVLDADNMGALTEWFREHQYAMRPAVLDWLEYYVAMKWKLTAFRYAAGPDAVVAAKAIRMSFATDVPFYPYREPEDVEPNYQRGLNLYSISSVPLSTGGTGFKPRYAAEFSNLSALEKVLSPGVSIPSPWLQLSVDNSPSRRGRLDPLFQRDAALRVENLPVKYIPHVYEVPIDLIVLGILGLIGITSLRRARR